MISINSPSDTLMIRRRSTVPLVLALVSFFSIVSYIIIDLRKIGLVSVYENHFIGSSDFEIQHATGFFEDVRDTNCSGGTLMFEEYCVLSPYEKEVRESSNAGSVTLCTQGTVEFLHHAVVLCNRWSGPISVAVFTPQEDYRDAQILVHLLRQCDACVRHWVSWHFFFYRQMKVPSDNQTLLIRDCSFIKQIKNTKRRKSQGIYPINVGRNVARQLAATPFLLSIDIELYPSLGIPAKFERMLRSQVLSPENQVWVLPVFEVNAKVRAPFLKSTLRHLFVRKQAISFHRYRCNICHKIPNLTQWLSNGEGAKLSEVEEFLEPLKIWNTVKRNRPYGLQDWEPFFIGTSKDPEFDIRLSWEGKQNKMQMAYEMCMRDYDFHIIENAFLVHAPGINIYNALKEKHRVIYLHQNKKVIDTIKHNLSEKYGFKKDC